MADYSKEDLKQLVSEAVLALRNEQFEQAVEITDEIISHDENHATAHAIRFTSLFKGDQPERARRMGGKTAQLNPNSEFILNNQACLQLEANQPAAAAGLLKSLIEQFGEQPQWLYNLALAQRLAGKFDQAIEYFNRTLDFKPDHDRAAFQVAECLMLVGDQDKAVSAFNYLRLLRSKHAHTHSQYISAAARSNLISDIDLELELALWGERFIPKTQHYHVEPLADPSTITIGFVIGQIADNIYNAIVSPVIESLAAEDDTVIVYAHSASNKHEPSPGKAQHVDCSALTDAEFAHRVRKDEVDALIDVCGIQYANRHRALGLQLAGRQFSWLQHEGKFATPLLASLDDLLKRRRYAFTKDIAKKQTAVAGLPSANKKAAASAKQLPPQCFAGISLEHGLSDQVLAVWVKILNHLPDWSLNIPSASSNATEHYRRRCQALGIDISRVQFEPNVIFADDTIVLDNFTSNNPLESFRALNNGNALVTLKGELFPAQHSAYLLDQLGLKSELCSNLHEYQMKAIQLARGEAMFSKITPKQLRSSKVQDVAFLSNKIRKILVAD